MMQIALYLPVILIGYLLGCSNLAWFLAKRKGVDIRGKGSGNPGASNAMILMGWKAGILVGLHDIGKAALAVWLGRTLFPALPLAGELAGAACVLGHLYPFYLRFRGGKGFAAYLGMAAVLNWRFALGLGLAILVLVLITDYMVVGTMTTVVSYPLYNLITRHFLAAAVLAVISLFIVYKHRENFRRILNGTEIGLRRANRGELREKGD